MGKGVSRKASEYKSVLTWLILCFIAVYMFTAPFYQGLFNGGEFSFERPIYFSMLWSAVALIAIAIFMYNRWTISNLRGQMALVIWLIPLCYLTSLLQAASLQSAINELYIHIMYVVFFLIGAYFTSSNPGSMVIKYSILGSGYVIVIHGFLNWFGNVHYKDAVLDHRLSGVFQYPNSYAAYLTGLLIASLILINYSKKWYTTISYALMLVPICTSLLLTLSRGGLLALPFVLLIYLLFLSWRRQLFTLLYMGLAIVTALVIHNRMTKIEIQISQQYESLLSLKGWAILIAASILIAAIILFIQKYISHKFSQEQKKSKVFPISNVIIPLCSIVLLIISAILIFGSSTITDKLPEEIRLRVQSLNSEDSSIASRWIFYQDSFKIAKDYPLFGAGGGAWSSLYDQYKSFPYISRQTHNLISQVLVDTGYVGLVLFMIVFFLCWYIFIRNAKQQPESGWKDRLILPFFGLAILFHSAIDFDMSFVYLSAIVFLSMGSLLSIRDSNDKPRDSSNQGSKALRVYPIALAIIAIILFYESVQAVQGNSLFRKANIAAAMTGNYQEVKKPLDAAIKLQPDHAYYALYKTSILIQLYNQVKDEAFINEADELLTVLQRKEPYDRRMINERFNWYMAKGEYVHALEWSQSKLEQLPWDINLYEKIIGIYYELGNQARIQGSSEVMQSNWDQAFNWLEQFKRKIEEVHALPKGQQKGYVFTTTPSMLLPIAQIYYHQGNYDLAASTLSTVLPMNFEDQVSRAVVRWYLASLQQQNQNDQPLLERFISEYPEEEQQIKTIVENKM